MKESGTAYAIYSDLESYMEKLKDEGFLFIEDQEDKFPIAINHKDSRFQLGEIFNRRMLVLYNIARNKSDEKTIEISGKLEEFTKEF